MKKHVILFFLILVFAGCEKDLSPVYDPTVTVNAVDSLKAPFEIKTFSYIPEKISIRDTVLIAVGISNPRTPIDYFAVYLISDTATVTPAPRFYLVDNGNDGDVTANDSIFTGKLKFDLSEKFYKENRIVIKPVDKSGKYYSCTEKRIALFLQNDPPVLSKTVNMPDAIAIKDTEIVTFTFSIKASDPQGLQEITSVFYKTYRPDGTTSGKEYSLYDNGILPDTTAGDGIYCAGITFPGTTTKGTWRFEFKAVDILGAISEPTNHKLTIK